MRNIKQIHYHLLFTLILLTSSYFAEFASATDNDLKDFTSDGCSLFPDGTLKDRAKWCSCCLQHDISYWQGGTADDRKKADEQLRDCVLERTRDKALSETMYLGVRAGGHPAFPIWYRWAYGWTYGRGYASLKEDEQSMVQQKLDDYWKRHPEGYCREKHPSNPSPSSSPP